MSEQGRETEMEEDEGGGASDTAPMLPRRPPDHQASALTCPGWLGLAARGLGPLLLPGRLLHLLLPATAFLLVLLPAATVVYLGFLCHSRVSLHHPRVGDLLGSWASLGLKATVPLLAWASLGLKATVPLPASPLVLGDMCAPPCSLYAEKHTRSLATGWLSVPVCV
nr:transmembrane protein 88B [Aotus nancymaae]